MNQCAVNHLGVNTRAQRATNVPRGSSIRKPAAERAACAYKSPSVRDMLVAVTGDD